MTVFKITVKESQLSNGVRLHKGMYVEIASKYPTNPMIRCGGKEVEEAFKMIYDVDLRRFGGGGISNLVNKMAVEGFEPERMYRFLTKYNFKFRFETNQWTKQ
jgi:hypothetical protein